MRGILSRAVSGVILTLLLTGMLASTLAVTSGNWAWVRNTVTGYYGEAVPGETYAADNVKVNGIVNVILEFASTLLLFVVFVATMIASMFMKRKLTPRKSSSVTSTKQERRQGKHS